MITVGILIDMCISCVTLSFVIISVTFHLSVVRVKRIWDGSNMLS